MIENMYVRLAELENRVNNIIRFGIIKSVDIKTNKVVVDMGDKLVTPELPYFANSSGNASVYFVPKIADQVIIISKNGDIASSFVMPSIYKSKIEGIEDEWRLEFAKGSIKYKEGKLEIISTNEVIVDSPKSTINSDQIFLKDDTGGKVVCMKHTCSFTGNGHVAGSSKVFGAL